MTIVAKPWAVYIMDDKGECVMAYPADCLKLAKDFVRDAERNAAKGKA